MDEAKPVWAGFWRRVGAYLIDTIILGAIGFAAAIPFYDALAALEGPTRLIGLGVGALYFGLSTSNLGGGASLGMRALGLKVVKLDGRPAGLGRALWRALVLQTPMMLNGMSLSGVDAPLMNAYTIFAFTLVFGVGLAQILLLLFNAPTRRLVHDLVSGTAVVRKEAGTIAAPRSRAPVAAAVVVLLAFLAALALIFLPIPWLSQTAGALTATQDDVLALPEVMEAGVLDSTDIHIEGGESKTTRTLVITARLNHWPADQDKEAARVRDAALKRTKLNGRRLRVVLTRGYDIGIASGSNSYTSDVTPATPAPPPQPAQAPEQPK
jgi:uncharacterized RDD family membrane protein YckC